MEFPLKQVGGFGGVENVDQEIETRTLRRSGSIKIHRSIAYQAAKRTWSLIYLDHRKS